MEIRSYTQADRESCLAVFDSNVPGFFAAAEREEFGDFLEAVSCPYFVMEHEGTVVGCGGYAVRAQERMARLVWGMVLRGAHRQGLGRFLLLYRLREIGKLGGVDRIGIETSQHAAGFFEGQGFRVVSVAPDGFAAGIDKVEMVKKMEVCR